VCGGEGNYIVDELAKYSNIYLPFGGYWLTPHTTHVVRTNNQFDTATINGTGAANFFKKYSINKDTYTRMNIQSYEYMHVHHISMSIFERLSQFDFEIYEVGH
jgi:hypothetical protein